MYNTKHQHGEKHVSQYVDERCESDLASWAQGTTAATTATTTAAHACGMHSADADTHRGWTRDDQPECISAGK
jgi:hypothetical protein